MSLVLENELQFDNVDAFTSPNQSNKIVTCKLKDSRFS